MKWSLVCWCVVMKLFTQCMCAVYGVCNFLLVFNGRYTVKCGKRKTANRQTLSTNIAKQNNANVVICTAMEQWNNATANCNAIYSRLVLCTVYCALGQGLKKHCVTAFCSQWRYMTVKSPHQKPSEDKGAIGSFSATAEFPGLTVPCYDAKREVLGNVVCPSVEVEWSFK